jgi:3-oxo-5-alpha-steroid 4-dehydrogenase 1
MNYFDSSLQYLIDEKYIVGTSTIEDSDLRFWYTIIIFNSTLATIAMISGFFGLLAPYGSESRQPSAIPDCLWGPKINSKLGWYVMEVPGLIVALLFSIYYHVDEFLTVPIHCQFAIGLYICHYFNRGIVFPSKRGSTTTMEPSFTFFLGALFNSGNAFTIVRYLTCYGQVNALINASNFRISVSTLIFFVGVGINMMSDEILFMYSEQKRKEKNTAIRKQLIPTGFFMFNYVTASNYFGELLEWFGFFILTFPSPASLCFLYMTFCNLAPR